jgi:phospholipid N-methyltransferase/membrane protein DedA with SNARE-associated domain
MDPLASLLPWLAAYGVFSLVGIALFERLMPVVPSYGLLVTIGIGAGDGYWSLATALVASTAGGLAGALLFYLLGLALGQGRAYALLQRTALFFGVSRARFDRWVVYFRRHATILSFATQMVPTIRLIAPGIAGLLRAEPRTFLVATALGVALWNTLFICVGYAAVLTTGSPNASAVALVTLVVLLAGEGALALIARQRSRRAAAGPAPAEERRAPPDGHDSLAFFRAWLGDPLRVGGMVPSGRALAKLITADITPASAPVIELGPGTGAFTRLLLARGVAEDQLVLIEARADFAGYLVRHFPAARVSCLDAARLNDALPFDGMPAGATVSGVPILSMAPEKVIAILDGAFRNMRPDGAFYQFTYGLRCPVPRRILDRLGLEATRVGSTLANVPPATVYRIRRRADDRP